MKFPNGTEMDNPNKYWFPAKRYGWGWGLPVRWQGWVCLAIYAGCVALVIRFLRPAVSPVVFAISLVLLTLGLMAVCWLKGEPPRWRSGS
jgi:hypothetical protein